MALPGARPGGAGALPRAARASRAQRPCSCTRSTSSTWPRPTRRCTARASRRCGRRSTPRCALGADGVVVHVGSHLGTGFEAGLERAVPALRQVLERCSRHDLAAARGLGRCGRDDGPIGRGARAARRRARRARAARDLPRHVPSLGLGRRRDRSGRRRRDGGRGGRADRTRPAARAARERRGRAARLRTATGTPRSARASSASGMGAFLAHPKLQGLPAVLETPGPDGHGPDRPSCGGSARSTAARSSSAPDLVPQRREPAGCRRAVRGAEDEAERGVGLGALRADRRDHDRGARRARRGARAAARRAAARRRHGHRRGRAARRAGGRRRHRSRSRAGPRRACP